MVVDHLYPADPGDGAAVDNGQFQSARQPGVNAAFVCAGIDECAVVGAGEVRRSVSGPIVHIEPDANR